MARKTFASFKVFISFKNLDDNGNPTRDSEIAEEIYHALSELGIEVFFSNEEVQNRHRSDYGTLINEALDSSVVLILVATAAEHIEANWVEYEWNSFNNEINSGRKDGHIVSVIEGISVGKLPYALRQRMVYRSDEIDRMINMVIGIPGVSEETEDSRDDNPNAVEAAIMKKQGDQYYFALDGISQDFYTAVIWYRRAAERGNSRAQFTLGCCYEYGNGVEANLEEAIKWYRKAAANGSRYAKVALRRFE